MYTYHGCWWLSINLAVFITSQENEISQISQHVIMYFLLWGLYFWQRISKQMFLYDTVIYHHVRSQSTIWQHIRDLVCMTLCDCWYYNIRSISDCIRGSPNQASLGSAYKEGRKFKFKIFSAKSSYQQQMFRLSAYLLTTIIMEAHRKHPTVLRVCRLYEWYGDNVNQWNLLMYKLK